MLVQSSIQQAREVLKNATRVLVVTGAGISAESGVPTFRGEGARWRNKEFTELASPDAFANDPREIWDWYMYRRGIVAGCQVNAAHQALADWAKSRSGVTLVTQNVDGLHERAGHPDVIRFHGSLWKNRCLACGTEREVEDLVYASLPISPCCQSLERPAIVWFGENVPFDAIHRGTLAAIEADAVLVVGTSGTVYPAAGLLLRARHNRTPIIEVNPQDSDVPATHVIRERAALAIPQLLSI